MSEFLGLFLMGAVCLVIGVIIGFYGGIVRAGRLCGDAIARGEFDELVSKARDYRRRKAEQEIEKLRKGGDAAK